jgi:hypothetical protein
MNGTSSIFNNTATLMTASTTTITSFHSNLNNQNLNLNKSRFPRLQECAHFHYEINTIDIPKNFHVILCSETEEQNSKSVNPTISTSNSYISNGSDSTIWFQLQVTSNDKKWNIYRTNENFKYLDKYLHDCIFDRKFSCLIEPVSFNNFVNNTHINDKTNSKSRLEQTASKQIRNFLSVYLERFCEIAFINPINCGPILNWFEVS